MRVRCLVAEASQYWENVQGQIYEMPDAQAEMLIALGKFERADNRCPHCGAMLSDPAEQTAALGAMPQTTTLPRAAKRG